MFLFVIKVLRKQLELVCTDAGFSAGEGLGGMGVDGLFELPSSISSSVLPPSMASPPTSPMKGGASSPISPPSTSRRISGGDTLSAKSVYFDEDDEDDNAETDNECDMLDPNKDTISYINSPTSNVSYIAYFDERVRSYFLTFMAGVMDGYDNFLIDPKVCPLTISYQFLTSFEINLIQYHFPFPSHCVCLQSDWEEQHANSFDKQGFVTYAVCNLAAKQLRRQQKFSPKQLEKNKQEIDDFGSFVDELIQTQMFAVFEHVNTNTLSP